MDIKGNVFNIQKFSVHDGPGIRTTVFLKGCPLSCKWCHNPESISPKPVLAFYSFRCKGCGKCIAACPSGALKNGVFDRSLCAGCGKCAKACLYGARELFGYEATAGQVMEKVLEDEIFYQTSGGGMTISGGEPFFQPDFTLALLSAAKKAGLHTAVETNLYAKPEHVRRAAAGVDLFFVDIKFMDPEKHKEYCGADNALILGNIKMLSGLGAKIVFRTPVIPGVNDGELEDIARFINSLPERHPLELLKYHDIGAGKYEALGMSYCLGGVRPEDTEKYAAALRAAGTEVISGS